MITTMATRMEFPNSRTILLHDGMQNVHSSHSTRHYLQRNRNITIAVKFLQLLLAIACLVLFSSGDQLYSGVVRTSLAYGTFGAYIIIPTLLIAGFIIGEESPILLVGYNLFGAVLFSIVGAFGIDSWWRVQMDLDHTSVPNMAEIQHLNDLKLISSILSLVNAVFYAADSVVEGIFIREVYRRN